MTFPFSFLFLETNETGQRIVHVQVVYCTKCTLSAMSAKTILAKNQGNRWGGSLYNMLVHC